MPTLATRREGVFEALVEDVGAIIPSRFHGLGDIVDLSVRDPRPGDWDAG